MTATTGPTPTITPADVIERLEQSRNDAGDLAQSLNLLERHAGEQHTDSLSSIRGLASVLAATADRLAEDLGHLFDEAESAPWAKEA